MSVSAADALEVLGSTPATLHGLLDGRSTGWTDTTDASGWGARDVLNHLIHGERTDWIPRARLIATHGESQVFEPFERDALVGANRDRPMAHLVDEFAALRAEGLATLRDEILPAVPLTATGTHPSLGRVTLGELLATWAVHDLEHVAQVAAAMAQHYRAEVGPWRAYLEVLRS